MSMNERKFLPRAFAAGTLLVLLCAPGHAARNVRGAGGEREKWLDLAARYPLTAPLPETVRPAASMLARWWDALDDGLLTELVERALRHNKDMDAALARVREARAALGIAEAALAPSVNLAGEVQKSRRADNAGGTGERDWYRLGFDASWEIDLFGRLRSGASARRALELAEDRYRQGLSDFGDVLAAQGALLSMEDGLASSAGSLTAALVRLYKALGGGWAPLSEAGENDGADVDARLHVLSAGREGR